LTPITKCHPRVPPVPYPLHASPPPPHKNTNWFLRRLIFSPWVNHQALDKIRLFYCLFLAGTLLEEKLEDGRAAPACNSASSQKANTPYAPHLFSPNSFLPLRNRSKQSPGTSWVQEKRFVMIVRGEGNSQKLPPLSFNPFFPPHGFVFPQSVVERHQLRSFHIRSPAAPCPGNTSPPTALRMWSGGTRSPFPLLEMPVSQRGLRPTF